LTPGVGRQERRQAVRAGDVEHAVGAPLGDGRQLADGDGEEVAHERHRSAVEVAAALDPTVGEDHRVVDRRRRSSRSAIVRACAIVSSAAPCTCGVHRNEYASCTRPSPSRWLATIGRAREQAGEVAGARRLADLRAQRLQVGGERPVGAEQPLDRHRRSDVGESGERTQIVQREAEHAEDAVGAVDQRQALLRPQLHRSQAGAASASAAGSTTGPSRSTPRPRR
jgi:hypothetical protein